MSSTKIKEKEAEFILANYKNTSSRAMVSLLEEATGTRVEKTAIQYFLKKRGLSSGLKTGWTKGARTNWSEGAKERCANTQFKKGNVPFQHKEMWHETLRSDGYVWIKIGEDEWVLRGRKKWMDAHPDVVLTSEDYVMHLNGDKTDDSLENLYVVSRGDMAHLNRDHAITECAELTKATVLNNRIKRKVKHKNDRKR